MHLGTCKQTFAYPKASLACLKFPEALPCSGWAQIRVVRKSVFTATLGPLGDATVSMFQQHVGAGRQSVFIVFLNLLLTSSPACRRFQRPFAEGAGVQPTLRRAVLHLRQRGPTFLNRATVFVGRVWRLLRRRKQVCLPPSFCLVFTPVPNHPHHIQGHVCCQREGGHQPPRRPWLAPSSSLQLFSC